jgi:hypothetical protein
MTTPTKYLPEMSYNQSQKHVTHNEALRMIDGLLLLTVQDKDLSEPPADPVNGTCYIPSTTATGVWSGYENYIAHYHTSSWHYYSPWYGWYAFVSDEQAFYWWDNNSWQKFATVLASGTNYWSQNGNVTYTLDPVGIGTPTVSGVMLAIDGGIRCTSITVDSITTSGIEVNGNIQCVGLTTSGIEVNGNIDITGDMTVSDVTVLGIKINSATDWFGAASVPDAPALTSADFDDQTTGTASTSQVLREFDGDWEDINDNFSTVATEVNKLRQDLSDTRLQLNDLLAQLRISTGCGVIDG